MLEREQLVDNLIERSGELEAGILERNDYAETLENELSRQKEHIKNLDTAIEQRDEHVSHLENRVSTTLELLSNRDLNQESIADLKRRLQAGFDEFRQFQSLVTPQFDNLEGRIERILNRLEKRIDSGSRDIRSEISNLHDQNNSLSSSLHHLNNTVVTADDTNKILDVLTESQAQLQIVKRMEKEIADRDIWGGETQARLNQLVSHISAMENSFSWRLTSPLRLLIPRLKWLVRILAGILFLPYKILMRIGWSVAPKLFHRIYHMPTTQKIRRAMRRHQPSPQSQSSVEVPSTPVSTAGNNELASQGNLHQWQLGERIDGPEQ